MENYPIYTVDTECQDCYKCVRHCPVKAIRVNDGHAMVVPELCTACGSCVTVCPAHAKRVRSDIPQLLQLLRGDTPVYASIAPSYISEFRDVTPSQIISACKKLGFSGVSETALGAQIVSKEVSKMIDKQEKGLLISSACPTMVDFIRLYLPDFVPYITPVLSPLLSHSKMLHELYGDDIKVVFIGPCIAKKNEADSHSDILNLSITFAEFKQLLREEKINLKELDTSNENSFVPHSAKEGQLYPIEGGMIETIKAISTNTQVHYSMVCGLDNLRQTLQTLNPNQLDTRVFLEVLACNGGCVHGPCTEHDSPRLLERLRVQEQVDMSQLSDNEKVTPNISEDFTAVDEPRTLTQKMDITEALLRVGKKTQEDELNCGGCGYDSCLNFATALAYGKAEPSMCVSYMRQLAQNKANGLLRSMPSGVIIVDKDLNIIECNYNFALAFGEDTVEAFEASPGLCGADIRRIVPFSNWFETALATGEDFKREYYRIDKKLFNITIFTIAPHEVVGAVIADVTLTELRREQIAARAKKVIDNNLAVVQDIACRLGEQMADTELILRSIAEDYAEPSTLNGDKI